MVRLHPKSFEIDSSHMDDGEVKLRIELTSEDAAQRDRSWIAMAPMGCAALIFGIAAGVSHEWGRAGSFGAAAALCFLSVGQGRWRRYLRVALAILFALLLALGIYLKFGDGRAERAPRRSTAGSLVTSPRCGRKAS